MRPIALTVYALIAFALIATASFEAPACAQRMAANSLSGMCFGS